MQKEGRSNMKILVIGSGKVGAASAWDLVKNSEMEKEERT
jgi:saccharopine dehydrogenase-like NADP-dependent oxidoreductase